MNKTQIISVREFRQNTSLYLKATKYKKIHFIVMNHSEPMAELIPTKLKKKTRKELDEELFRDIQVARAQAARGELYTTEEVRQHLGLPSSPYIGRQKRKRR